MKKWIPPVVFIVMLLCGIVNTWLDTNLLQSLGVLQRSTITTALPPPPPKTTTTTTTKEYSTGSRSTTSTLTTRLVVVSDTTTTTATATTTKTTTTPPPSHSHSNSTTTSTDGTNNNNDDDDDDTSDEQPSPPPPPQVQLQPAAPLKRKDDSWLGADTINDKDDDDQKPQQQQQQQHYQDVQTIFRVQHSTDNDNDDDDDDDRNSDSHNSNTGSPPHQHAAAYEMVRHRQTAYQQHGIGPRWKLRGLGYLYHYWNMILVATVVPTTTTTTTEFVLPYGRNVIAIHNVVNTTTTTSSSHTNHHDDDRNDDTSKLHRNRQYQQLSPLNCSQWTIYVRVNGPEIFAGSANAVFIIPSSSSSSSSSRTSTNNASNNHTKTKTTTNDDDDDDATPYNYCFWEFPFHLQIVGTYTVDVKLLYYNAASIMESPCTIHSGTVETLTTSTTTVAAAMDEEEENTTDSHRDASTTTTTTTTATTRTGFKGFKMYTPAEMCCEICSRLQYYNRDIGNDDNDDDENNDCIYWSTPPLQFINTDIPASRVNNGCDLYFPASTSSSTTNTTKDPTSPSSSSSDGWSHIESMFVNNTRTTTSIITTLTDHQSSQSQPTTAKNARAARLLRFTATTAASTKSTNLDVLNYHGPPNGVRSTYFLGCGWSFWMTLDFPCLDGNIDDQIYIANNNNNNNPNEQNTFTFTGTTTSHTTGTVTMTSTMSNERIADASMIISTNNHANNSSNSSSWSTVTTNSLLQPVRRDAAVATTLLPLCTLDMEQPTRHHVDGRWVRYPWPNTTICPHDMEIDPQYSQQFTVTKYDPDRPRCYFRDDLSIIGHTCIEMNCRFITNASKWTTSSLHLEKQWYGYYEPYRCRYSVDYTDSQLQTCIIERKIYKIDGSGKSIWHFLREYLYQRIGNLTLYDNTANDGLEIHLSSLQLTHEPTNTLRTKLLKDRPWLDPNRIEFYWVNSVYMSSEREQEARGAVQLIKSSIVQDVLGSRNYHMLNLYDMTKAFTYDTATQMDGFHIIGPPMKMLITKLFHYMCYNTSVALH